METGWEEADQKMSSREVAMAYGDHSLVILAMKSFRRCKKKIAITTEISETTIDGASTIKLFSVLTW